MMPEWKIKILPKTLNTRGERTEFYTRAEKRKKWKQEMKI